MLHSNNVRFYVCITRFNNNTFSENEKYREKHDFDGCVYGSPCEIPKHIPIKSRVFVLEMNNEENKIMGIGYMYNKANYRTRHKIYSINDYNRYTYIGKYRVDRYDLNEEDKEFLKVIEKKIFYSKTHQKRGHGFNCISEKNMIGLRKHLMKWLCRIFMDKYKYRDVIHRRNENNVKGN